jgi:hypothetical protein
MGPIGTTITVSDGVKVNVLGFVSVWIEIKNVSE